MDDKNLRKRIGAKARNLKVNDLHDPELEAAVQKILVMQKFATELKTRLIGMMNGISGTSASFLALASCFQNPYSKDAELHAVVTRFAGCHRAISEELPKKLQGLFTDVVIGPVNAWLGSIQQLKENLKVYSVVSDTFRHYDDKYAKLKKDVAARQAAGKSVKMDKLRRNERKLNAVRETRDEKRAVVLAALQEAYATRYNSVDTFLLRVIQFQVQYFKEASEKALKLGAEAEAIQASLKARPKLVMGVVCDCVGLCG